MMLVSKLLQYHLMDILDSSSVLGLNVIALEGKKRLSVRFK
jgi:hypothetical protein